MSRKPKTQDLEWLVLSLMSFNGSGYADMSSAEGYLDSYIKYKTMRKKTEAVLLARRYHDAVIPTIDELLAKTYGAGRVPSNKKRAQFDNFRSQTTLT